MAATNGPKEVIDASLASTPCDFGAVFGLLAAISAQGENLSIDDRKTRLEMLENVHSLVRALETPRETMLKHVGGQTAAFFCLTLGHDVGLFDFMAADDGSPKSVTDLAKGFKDNLIAGFNSHGEEDPVMLVDIGGGLGHDLVEFRQKHSDAPGRLVLEDLSRVLDEITNLQDDIERVPYDFLMPQPVKGARAYYMHQIMHDYPDDRCVEIVEQVKDAMKPGYSKLLINEHIIPAAGANWEATYLDLYMMVLFSARERTEYDWRHLLEKRCGLKICKFWNPGSGVE